MKIRNLLMAAILGLFLLPGLGRADENCEAFIAGLLPAKVDKGTLFCDYMVTPMFMSHLEVKANWPDLYNLSLWTDKYAPNFPNWDSLKNELYRQAKVEYDKDVKEWSDAKSDDKIKYGPNETKLVLDARSFCQTITEYNIDPLSKGSGSGLKYTRCKYLVTSEGVILRLTVYEANRAGCDGYFTKAREKAKKM